MNNKGFTLVELLAVIVVLGLLISIASSSVFKMISASKEKTARLAEENLAEAAVTYVKGERYALKKCEAGVEYTNVNVTGDCIIRMTVGDLISKGGFTDESNSCDKSKYIIVYRYLDNNGIDELRSYVEEGTCSN